MFIKIRPSPYQLLTHLQRTGSLRASPGLGKIMIHGLFCGEGTYLLIFEQIDVNVVYPDIVNRDCDVSIVDFK